MTNRRSIALLGLLIAGFAVAVIAAFGSGDANAGAEARAKGATAVPADALAYASINMDRGGSQFQALEQLATKVQGGQGAVDRLNQMLDGSGEQAQLVRALGGAVVALVVAAGIRMGRKVVKTRWTLAIAVIAGVAMLLGQLRDLGPVGGLHRRDHAVRHT